jgi:hypothetical protein
VMQYIINIAKTTIIHVWRSHINIS